MAHDGDCGARGSGGLFRFSEKESIESLFRSVASQLVHFKAYRSINACQDISLIQYKEQPAGEKTKVNMAEGPRPTATPSNQFVVKYSVRGHHLYKRIWSPSVGEPFETFCEWDNEHDKYAVAVHLNNLKNNPHLPLLYQEQWVDNW